jgi:hypothetical protein
MSGFVTEFLSGAARRIARGGLAVVAAAVMVAGAGVFAQDAAAQVVWKPTYGGNTSYDSDTAAAKPYYPQKKSASATGTKKKSSGGVKVAALGKDTYDYKPKKPSITGGSVNWVASSGCLDGSLKSVIYQVASNYGPVTVNSTCRSKSRNAAVGGAPRSKHLTGDAADFRVSGNVGATYAFLKSHGSVGGLKHYGGGLFHIDNGERRTW